MLPTEFAALEPFVAAWCFDNEPQRWERRLVSSMGEMQAFYDAIFPRAEEAIAYCDTFPLHEMPDDARRLFRLLEALALVSYAVEVWGQPLPMHVGNARMERTREPQL